MLIAINCQSLVKDHLEGLGWFTYESLKRITRSHPEHEFLLIFGKGIADEFIFSDNVKAINIGPPFFRPQAWWLKFEWLLPRILKKHNVDLFVSSDGISSTKIKVKQLNVIHDLNFEENPQWLPKSFANYYRKYFPIWAKKADRIATVSEYSKQDIHQRYGVDLDKIDVVYNGSNDLYQPVSEQIKEETKQKYTDGKPYFIFVGSLHPRKNIDHLLKGYDLFKSQTGSEVKLVIVGGRFYWSGAIKEAFNKMKHQDEVIFTGHLPTEDLKNLMGSSLALTYLSLFEGFGIPLLEAMNSETAILTSNKTCLPEIAKDAAIYIDPLSDQDIANGMQKIAEDSQFRAELIANGRIRRKHFSWDKTAERLWTAIEKTIQQS